MAPPKNRTGIPKGGQDPSQPSGGLLAVKPYLTRKFLHRAIFDPHCLMPVCILLLIFEVVLNIVIVENVRYTEIDWRAYMQEVEGFLNGTLDYSKLKGDTGPLVYPAGFVYVYSALYYLTDHGRNIKFAQYMFIMFYLIQTVLTFRIHKRTAKIPPFALMISTLTSYRIHSIFVLRLFNDPIAVLLFYASLNLFISDLWKLGSVFFSLAVAVKMNILLYAPCLLLAYLVNLGYVETAVNLTICAAVQLILGLPFLLSHPVNYVKGAFDFGRVFEHKWTVNYRFLSQSLFVSPLFHVSLLMLHIGLLMIFLPSIMRYFRSYAKLTVVTSEFKRQMEDKRKEKDAELSEDQLKFLKTFEGQMNQHQGNEGGKGGSIEKEQKKFEEKMGKIAQLLVLPFYVTNLVGVACARSLHYQFYSWYFHSLLYLVFCTGYKKPIAFLLLALIEYCWNIYPSTDLSSGLLHLCHGALLFGVYRTMRL